jgi:HlyD family secretion protein
MKIFSSRKFLVPGLALGAVLAAVTVWQIALAAGRCATNLPLPASSDRKVPACIRAEGRIACYPGAQVEVGAELSGLLVELPVQENQVIEKGALVAALKSDELRASLAEAQARVAELDAEKQLAELDLDRDRGLFLTGAISRQALDRISRDLAVIQARRASAAAAVARLEATLAKTRITAPLGGVVLRRRVAQGETIEAGARLITLADLRRVRIEAEVDEYDAGTVAVGQPVRITAEGFDGQSWKGVVEEVPRILVEKGLQPRDPARPIDVRVLLVKIAVLEPTPLKLGQRAEIEIIPEDRATNLTRVPVAH